MASSVDFKQALTPNHLLLLRAGPQCWKKLDWPQARVEGKVLLIRSCQVGTEDGRVYWRLQRHLRRTRDVMPHGRVEMGSPPRAAPTTATANASCEIFMVPPATPSTAVSKVHPERAPVQKTDRPQAENPVQTTVQSMHSGFGRLTIWPFGHLLFVTLTGVILFLSEHWLFVLPTNGITLSIKSQQWLQV